MHRQTLSSIAVLLLVGVLGVSCGEDKPQPPANRAPTVNSLTAQPTEVTSGGTVTLALDASDPDGNELTYTWKQEPASPAGTFNDTAARTPTWKAPTVNDSQTSFTLSVTVSDGTAEVVRTVTVPVTVPRYIDVQNIWNTVPSCTTCHGSNGGLNLSAANSYANLVNVTTVNSACSSLKRVLPGDPDNSSLVRKIEGTTCGTRMPSNNPGLRVRIRSWILAGASND